jgi:hypothetical protein
LAVDDGVANRGHRTNIFNVDWQEFGSCYGTHKTYREMVVIIYRGRTSSGSAYDGKAAGSGSSETPTSNDTSSGDNKSDSGSSDSSIVVPKSDLAESETTWVAEFFK